MKIELVPINEAPEEWKDGRQCLAVDFLGEWRVVRWRQKAAYPKGAGEWTWYVSSDLLPFAYEMSPSVEVIAPTHLAALEEPDNVEP